MMTPGSDFAAERCIDEKVLDSLVACPGCDVLYRRPQLLHGGRAHCLRCHSVVATRKQFVVQRMLASVTAMGMLLVAAMSFPFLSLSKAGIEKSVSMVEAVASLSREGFWIAVVALALVVGIPALRTGLQIYVLMPLALSRRPPRHAAIVYRFVTALRPWAMAEVFTIGVLVAMVKVGSLAELVVGPAFLALLTLVFLIAYESIVNCETTLWTYLRDS